MIKHYITKYVENETKYAESWIQVEVLGKTFCFFKKRIAL